MISRTGTGGQTCGASQDKISSRFLYAHHRACQAVASPCPVSISPFLPQSFGDHAQNAQGIMRAYHSLVASGEKTYKLFSEALRAFLFWSAIHQYLPTAMLVERRKCSDSLRFFTQARKAMQGRVGHRKTCDPGI